MFFALFFAASTAAASPGIPYDPIIYPPEVLPEDPVVGGEVRTEDGGALVLRHTDIVAEVHAGIARITMVQHFQNPYDNPLEAVYLLPLPDDAAVDSMELQVGDRVTEAWVMERKAARQAYEQAREEGKRAALLEQERENLFTQSVAGICPEEQLSITLQYSHQVDYEDGLYTLSLPTNTGPRYDPPWVEPEQAEAVDTPYAATGRSVDIRVYLDEGLPVEALFSDTHDLEVLAEGEWGAEVGLGERASPNRDFSMSWSLAGRAPRAAVVAHKPATEDWGYAALSLEPQIVDDHFVARPRELLFVLDASCSMRGAPYATSRATVLHALDRMREGDTFNLVKFGSAATSLFDRPRPATAENRDLAATWLRRFEGGGTNMSRGITHSLTLPGDPEAMRLVLMLTDGYISGERPLFDVVREHLGNARLFSLGVGHNVNRFLLEGLAEMGRGDVAYHFPGRTPVDETVQTFYGRIEHPAMSDIRIDWGELDVVDVYPTRIPDLWAGQPVRVVARYRRGGAGDVLVRGQVGRSEVELRMPVELPAVELEHEGLASLWARRRIRDIEWYPGERSPDQVKAEVTGLALEHHMVSSYTSLVAVDDAPCPCGVVQRSVEAAHDLPMGVDLQAAGGRLVGYGSGSVGVGYGSGSGTVQGRAGGSAGIAGFVGAKGVQRGGGSLGARGSGIGGGGQAQGLGGLGTGGVGNFAAKQARALPTVGGDPIILGALDKRLIDDVIKRHMNQIRYCYQRELQKKPQLAGRLTIHLEIAPDGGVRDAEVQSSSLQDAAVERCVVSRFERMSFPQPRGGGLVIVTYPFLFASSR